MGVGGRNVHHSAHISLVELSNLRLLVYYVIKSEKILVAWQLRMREA